MVFTGEKVRPEYPETVPEISPCRQLHGVRLVQLEDLIRMKLTSFRSKDETHIKDLDEAGAITPEIEAGSSAPAARPPATDTNARLALHYE